MSDFKTRLVSEQVELDEKLKKLNDFNQSEKVNEIDPVQKDLLLILSVISFLVLHHLLQLSRNKRLLVSFA